MWVVVLKVIEIFLKVKKIADSLTALSKGGLVGFIITYIVGKVFKLMGETGKLIGRVMSPETELLEFIQEQTKNFLPEVSWILDDLDVRPYILQGIDKSINWVADGKLIANGKSPVNNLSSKADPVILYTGEFERKVLDFVVRGAGIDFEFQRTYRSSAAYFGPLGINWDHSYNLWLREENDYVVVRLTGQLSEHRFFKHPRFGEDKFNYYAPPDGVHDVMVREIDGSFKLLKPSGTTHTYCPTSQPDIYFIEQITDRFGNYLKFYYSNDDRLERVFVNSEHRFVRFIYDEYGAGRLKRLEDHAGRAVIYSYNDFGFLESVAGPFNTGEKSEHFELYEYADVGNTLKLVRVYDGMGHTLVENEYEGNYGSEYFGRIIRQQENKGEHYFFYETIDDVDSTLSDRDRPSLKVWDYLRNGHEIVHILNALGNVLFTEEKVLEGGSYRNVITRYRYNADGEIIAKVDPNGVLTQFLFGRDYLYDLIQWEDFDPVIGDISLRHRRSFGNLLAKVIRKRKIADTEPVFNSTIWERIPRVEENSDPDDVIKKYEYDMNSGLLLSQSAPRYTTSADPLHPEEEIYKSHLTRYEYGPDPSYKLLKTIFPNRTRPSNINGTSLLTGVVEEIKSYDSRGRPLLRVDPDGFEWLYEYCDSSSAREGFLYRKLIPHINWALDENFPNILEVKRVGRWMADSKRLLSRGCIADKIQINVEGVRIVLSQANDKAEILSQNKKVGVWVDDIEYPAWNQAEQANYLVEDLSAGVHKVILQALIPGSISIGHVQTHVTSVFELDNLGFITCEIDPGGNKIERKYNALGQTIEVIDGSKDNPRIINYEYDLNGQLIHEWQEWKNEDGQLHPQKGVSRRYQYNQAGLLRSESIGSLDGNEARASQYRYDECDNRIQFINSRRVRTYYGYDELNRLVRTVRAGCSEICSASTVYYDYAGNIQAERNPRGALNYNGYRDSNGQWRAGLNTLGNVRVKTDPLKHLSVNDYDKAGNLTVVRRFQCREDSKFELMSRVVTQFDEHNSVTSVSEAIFDKPILTQKPVDFQSCDYEFETAVQAGNIKFSQTEFILDKKGNPEAIRNPDGGVQIKHFDGQGRVYEEINPEGRRVFYIFDGNGNIVRTYTYDPVRDNSGKIEEYEVFVQFQEYDELNRKIAHTDSYGNRWIQKYDTLGNLTTTIDPLQNTVRFEYNTWGQIVAKSQDITKTGLGNGDVLDTFVTCWEYDSNGNILAIVDPAGRRTEFRYDALDRLVDTWFSVDPDEPHEYRAYDRAGNLVQVKDRNGLIKNNKYDLLNRLERVDFDLSSVNNNQSLSPLSPKFLEFKYNSLGHLIRHCNQYSIVDIQRDSRGLPVSERVLITIEDAPNELEIRRQFNIAGQREKLIYPSGRIVSYSYNNAGQVVDVCNISSENYLGRPENADNFVLAHYKYVGNRLRSVEYGNGLNLKINYDGRGYVVDRVVSKKKWGGLWRSELWRMQLLRDFAGYVRAENATYRNGARSRKFYLDSTYRLTHYEDLEINWLDSEKVAPPIEPIEPTFVTNESVISEHIGQLEIPESIAVFEYDNMGNRLFTREPGLPSLNSVANELNQYIFVNECPWRYDANGNLHADNTRLYLYDFNNALQEISKKDSENKEVCYYRDALGYVVAEITDDNKIFRIYDGLTVLMEINITERREFTKGNLPDLIIHTALNNEDYWVIYDELHSMRLLANGGGIVNSMPFYRPFGAVDDNELKQSPLHFGFGGMLCSIDPVICISKFRSYRTDIGRNFQRDPIGFVDDLNLYTYAGNNPVNFYDPRGLFTEGWGILGSETFNQLDPASNITLGEYQLQLNPYSKFSDIEQSQLVTPWDVLTSHPAFEGMHQAFAKAGEYPWTSPAKWLWAIAGDFAAIGGTLVYAQDFLLTPIGQLTEWIDPTGDITISLFQSSLQTPIPIDDLFCSLVMITRNASRNITSVNRLFSKSWKWENVSRRLRREGWAAKNQPIHHRYIPRGGTGKLTLGGFFQEQYGRFIPDIIKNQKWNLQPMESRALHEALHGKGEYAFNNLERLWYGSGPLFKAGVAGSGIGISWIASQLADDN
jgi:RHS repeat-associated protein